jgi:hypothetical protein
VSHPGGVCQYRRSTHAPPADAQRAVWGSPLSARKGLRAAHGVSVHRSPCGYATTELQHGRAGGRCFYAGSAQASEAFLRSPPRFRKPHRLRCRRSQQRRRGFASRLAPWANLTTPEGERAGALAAGRQRPGDPARREPRDPEAAEDVWQGLHDQDLPDANHGLFDIPPTSSRALPDTLAWLGSHAWS